ncbi:MAG: DNA polymerase III subunit alpha [Lachnospiraceae bacterium]|nr:DNA polymerase III subunit alpha [Lachnospiraceae bacterium]
MSFVHLHTHTEYSLLDGSNKIKEYVSRVKALGMDSAAITDHGVMYGVIDFYKECQAQDIKPIIGCEVYVALGSRFDKSSGVSEDRYHHLVLLCENNTGYANLMKMVSLSFTEGFYYKPRVDMELLAKYHEGLIALSACLAGEIPNNILMGFRDKAEEAALRLESIFGKGNFFLELQDHGNMDQHRVNPELLKLSKKLDIPLVCTNDVHYTYREDERPHDILLCIQTAKKLSDENRLRYEGGQYYIKSEEEMSALFPYAPEALENTARIAERCRVEIEFHNTKLPHFDIPKEFKDSREYLAFLVNEGFKKRYPDDDGRLRKRMEYELSVIEHMGYVDYFLIVWDYINFAREHGIAVGPGRGSAAGSIVSYALRITDIDPIAYDLLFERFLNPERISMPDIDVDFEYERRQEVIDYVIQKYGQSKCVQIVTFGTLAAKGVIRDVTRVMDLPYSFGDKLARMIPGELNITLEKALRDNNDFRKLYESDETVRDVIDMSMRLEGLPRHTSIHAAGILITPEDADKYVPLSRGANGEITTQFTMTTLEELGLLKMDFLGLRTLGVIKTALKFINSTYEEYKETPLNIDKIDYNDPKVMEFISTGKTDGVFQIESPGMQRFMKDLKPESLEDIIAGIALYRPGPMDFIPKYVAGKKNQDNVKYDCPELEPILKPTYGCIVYQEQVMQIVQQLGGYTLGRADLVRRAMSKKKQKVMEEEEANFVHGNKEQGVPGCIALGIDEGVARHIYAEMMDFAKYAFNKSHAAAYAYVTMQTAFLKCYYPVEFMAAILTSVMDINTKLSSYLLSVRDMGIKLLPPDINKSYSGFSPSDGTIRYGLSAIRSVGVPVIKYLVEEREKNGPFLSMKDFIYRMDTRDFTKRTMEAFIKAGALSSLGGTRKQYMYIYENEMEFMAQERKDNMSGQISFFDMLGGEESQDALFAAVKGDRLPDVGEFPPDQLLAFEKEMLGVYVTGHPLDEYSELWRNNINANSADFELNSETNRIGLSEGKSVTIGGIITEIRLRQTKKGDTMAIFLLEDMLGTVEVITWPDRYMRFIDEIREDAKVFITGRVKVEDEKNGSLVADKIVPFEEVPRRLYIQFSTMADYKDGKEGLESLILENRGKDSVTVYIRQGKCKKTYEDNLRISANRYLMEKLYSLYGKENVKLR